MEPIAIAVALFSLLFVVFFLWRRASARAVRDRLVALLVRFEGADSLGEMERLRTLDKLLTRVEHSVDGERTSTANCLTDCRRFFEALCHVEQGVVVADEAGNVMHANQAVLRYMAGASAGEPADQTIRRLLAQSLRTGFSGVEEFEDEEFSLRLSVFPLNNGGRAIGAVVFVVDVSAEKKLDTIRRNFVDDVDRVLTLPLTALRARTHMLVDAENEPLVAQRLACQIDKEVQYVARVLTDLACLARLDLEGKPRQELVPADLLVADALRRFRRRNVARAVPVRLDVRGEGVVLGDRHQIITALSHLIENAVRYSEENGEVVVRVEPVRGKPGGVPEIEFVVIDEGSGIPQAHLPYVFERFHAIDRVSARFASGAGLGLCVVRQVVANHGGRLVIETEEGVGTSVGVYLAAMAMPRVSPNVMPVCAETRDMPADVVVDLRASESASSGGMAERPPVAAEPFAHTTAVGESGAERVCRQVGGKIGKRKKSKE